MSDEKMIHILYEYGGQWEDAWESAILSSFDLERLELVSDEKKIALVVAKHKREQYDNFRSSWIADNPSPQLPPAVDLLPIPRWPSVAGQKQVITDEMRAERAELQRKNTLLTEVAMGPWRKASDEWQTRYKSAISNWELENSCIGISNQRELNSRGYKIRSVPFME